MNPPSQAKEARCRRVLSMVMHHSAYVGKLEQDPDGLGATATAEVSQNAMVQLRDNI